MSLMKSSYAETGRAKHKRDNRMISIVSHGSTVAARRAPGAVPTAFLAMILAAGLVAALLPTGPPLTAGGTASAPIEPGQVLEMSPEHRAELAQLTDTAAKRAAFESNLRKGLAAFGARVSDKPPAGADTDAATLASGGVERVAFTGDLRAFSQGWDRDHWWLIMSYADVAYGGTAGATAACSVYLPWFICVPIGGIIASWVRGWGTANNHGIWLAVYRTGRITGGRW